MNLPDGFEQLELFRTSPTGEQIPIITLDNSDHSGKRRDKKWQNANVNGGNKRETDC